MRTLFSCAAVGVLLAGCLTPVGGPPSTPLAQPLIAARSSPPRAGDTAVYRVLNAYNSEPQGDAQYRVEKIDGGQVTVAVTTTSSYVGLPHTAIYTDDGNWLRHPLSNHDQQVFYDFSPPFIAYAFPLDPGRAWSMRVNAINTQTGRAVSVRIDGAVLGSERITTAAGAFDVIKIRRNVYAGDGDGFVQETHIVETDWYAPELGRSVRLESNSTWIDRRRGGGGGFPGFNNNQVMRGDWRVRELISYQANGKSGGGAPAATPAASR